MKGLAKSKPGWQPEAVAAKTREINGERTGSRLRRWRSRWELALGLLIAAGFAAVALAAPLLAPPPEGVDQFGNPLPPETRILPSRATRLPQAPSRDAPLGTTTGGMDVFHSLVWGARDALRFGLTVGLSAAALGVLVGVVSGFLGGWVDWLLMRLTDAFLTFPLIAGVILVNEVRKVLIDQLTGGQAIVLQITGPLPQLAPGVELLLSFQTAVILFSWMVYARLINAVVSQVKTREFVEAARALGAGSWRIMLRHIAPNSISPAIVLLSRDIGGLVLVQAAMTFIHMGGESVWGNLLVTGRDWIIGQSGNPLTYWWVFVPASLALILFGIGWSLIGDGLNDLINPHKQNVPS